MANPVVGQAYATLVSGQASVIAARGSPEAAWPLYQIGLEFDPGSFGLRAELIRQMLDAGKPAEALSVLDAAPPGNPDQRIQFQQIRQQILAYPKTP
jgi:thioredoxin-like negative regulator of GroEL